MHSGGNPEYGTAMVHKITLFIQVENCDNSLTLLFNVFPVCQDDGDLPKIDQANMDITKYQSNE